MTHRKTMELLVNERQHAIERVRVAVTPRAEQLRDLAAILCGHQPVHPHT